MKKLLLTSALAGVMISGSAFAQTTITGELRFNGKTVEQDSPAGTGSIRGLSSEQQINFQTKGKLNVGGLDYAAGFAIENDGAQTTTLFNENTYMDLTNASSGTTLSISRDHIQRSDTDRSAAVFVGFTPNELSDNGTVKTLFNQTLGAGVGQTQTIALLQKTPIGTLSYAYAPTGNAVASVTSGANPTGWASSEQAAESDEESAYEYGFTGDFGVKGLNTYYFKSEQKKSSGVATQLRDAEAKSWGVAYNMGQFSVGYADKKYNFIQASAGAGLTAGTKDISEKHYGVAYAVNNTLTIGAIYAKAEYDGNTADQKTKGINVGYNLGPVALAVGYAKNSDVGGTAGVDTNIGIVRLIGAF